MDQGSEMFEKVSQDRTYGEILRWSPCVFFVSVCERLYNKSLFSAFDNTRMCMYFSFSTIDDVDYSWHSEVITFCAE